jgi:hypothetical protein
MENALRWFNHAEERINGGKIILIRKQQIKRSV